MDVLCYMQIFFFLHAYVVYIYSAIYMVSLLKNVGKEIHTQALEKLNML